LFFRKKAEDQVSMDIDNLMDMYGDEVLHICMYFLKNQHDAEDAFQEIFVKIYKKGHTFRSQSSIKTWITSIAINTCKDILKSSWRRNVIEFSTIKEAGDHYYDEKKSEDEVYDTLQELPDIYKEVVYLKYYKEMTAKEIAKVLGISVAAVNSRLYRAKEELAIIFNEKGLGVNG